MRPFALTVLFCAALSTPVFAADIIMLAPASVALGAKELAEAYTKQTGNKVTMGGRGKMAEALKTGIGGDVIVLSTGDMDKLIADAAPASRIKLVSIPVGVAVKAGAPHPDISTPEKFRAAILASGSVSYTDPAAGTSAGATIDRVLKRQDYAGAKLKPVMGPSVEALAKGETEMALQMITEIPGVAGIELVGPVPPSVGAIITFDAVVPKNTPHSAEAQAFLRYLTRPEAAALWKAKGLQPAN